MSEKIIECGELEMIEQLSAVLQVQLTWESKLEGKMYTLIDGIFSDETQRKAVKDLMREKVHSHYMDINGKIVEILSAFGRTFENEKVTILKSGNDTDSSSVVEDSTYFKK